MKKLYAKSEISFTVIWIIIYCILMSVGDNLSAVIGVSDAVSLPIASILSAVLFCFMKGNGLLKKYGLCKSAASPSEMLFYIPLLLLLTVNLWYGISFNLTHVETVLYILKMFFVGFLEEIIFRGFLFKSMAKNGIRSAIIVSSVTFGIGHIIRLFNGSGAELFENILQVIYAVAVGFMFVMIFYKTGSLIPCILTHSIFNALSVFSDEAALTPQRRILTCIFIVAVSVLYSLYIFLAHKKKGITEQYVD